MTKNEKLAVYNGKLTELKNLSAKDEMTDVEVAQAVSLKDELKTLQAQIETDNATEKLKAEVKTFETFTQEPATTFIHGGAQEEVKAHTPSGMTGTYTGRRASALKAFKGENADAKAYGFGRFVFANLFGHEASKAWCAKNGVEAVKAAGEGSNVLGGVLVPAQYSTDIIDLREQYGVFRRNTKVEPMAGDTKQIPRRTGGVTAYFVGEGSAITDSDKAWDSVTLTARKLAALSYISNELNDDAFISVGDDIAKEMAYAFAVKEDDCAFNGDATSTYGGITGIRDKIKGLSGTIANIAGLTVATGTGYASSYGSTVLVDFEGVAAKLPVYADGPNAKWFCHKSYYYNVMLKVALASGGVTQAEVAAGNRTPSFLGYPVEFTQIMPSTPAVSQVVALLGDLSLGTKLGDRMGVEIMTSEHYRMANDQIAVRGIERVDIVVHDVGNAHATAASRVPGPIVGLITAAS